MSHMGLAELLGVKGKSIQWERPLLFFTALVVYDSVWPVLAPCVYNWGVAGGILHALWKDPEWHEVQDLLAFLLSGARSWIMAFLGGALVAGLATVALRFIPRAAAAVAAVVLVSSLLHTAIWLYWAKLMQLQLPAGIWKTVLGGHALWVCCTFGGLALGLRWIRPAWLALLVGGTVGSLVSHGTFTVLRWMSSKEASFDIKELVVALVASVVLGAALWAGLWLSSDRPSVTGEAPPRLRKGFYLGTLVALSGLLLLFLIAPVVMVLTEVWRQSRDLISALILIGMGLVIATYANVVWFALIYRMWAAIQDGHARTSPGRAVGFLFIPFYNFYWIFQAFPGFAKDFNAFAARHSLKVARMSSGLFTAFAILCLVAVVPWLDVLLSPAIVIVGLVMTSRVCDAVNAIPRSLPVAPTPAA